jgi:hypothetical protein
MSRVINRLLFFLLLVLSGCGGGSSDHTVTGFDYQLSIDGPETQSNIDPAYQYFPTSDGLWGLEGSGFLPPGTTCLGRTCHQAWDTNYLGFVEFAEIGKHELIWENEATGESGVISKGKGRFESSLYWACYCDAPPQWLAYIAVVPGTNRIIITQTSGSMVQQDEVVLLVE